MAAIKKLTPRQERFAREYLVAKCLGGKRFPVYLDHAEIAGVHLPGDIQLRQCPFPLTGNAQQLEQEDSMPSLGRLGSHLIL